MEPKVFKKYIDSLPKGAKILDAGCGKGAFSEYVRTMRPDLEFHGVDLNKEDKKAAPKFLNFHLMNITDMKKFKANTFDCILCFHVLEHLQDPREASKEFHRVLKKGGITIAECPHWFTAFSPIGFNFYDDPTHIRPHSKTSMMNIFDNFKIDYAGEGQPHDIYGTVYEKKKIGIKTPSIGKIFRGALNLVGLYKAAAYVVARK